FKVQRHAREGVGGNMNQLEQFRAGLLFGGVDVLIPIDDVDVDRQLFLRGSQWRIARGDLRIALRTQVPDGGRVLDEKREIVLREQRQNARGVRTELFAHAGVEA